MRTNSSPWWARALRAMPAAALFGFLLLGPGSAENRTPPHKGRPAVAPSQANAPGAGSYVRVPAGGQANRNAIFAEARRNTNEVIRNDHVAADAIGKAKLPEEHLDAATARGACGMGTACMKAQLKDKGIEVKAQEVGILTGTEFTPGRGAHSFGTTPTCGDNGKDIRDKIRILDTTFEQFDVYHSGLAEKFGLTPEEYKARNPFNPMDAMTASIRQSLKSNGYADVDQDGLDVYIKVITMSPENGKHAPAGTVTIGKLLDEKESDPTVVVEAPMARFDFTYGEVSVMVKRAAARCAIRQAESIYQRMGASDLRDMAAGRRHWRTGTKPEEDEIAAARRELKKRGEDVSAYEDGRGDGPKTRDGRLISGMSDDALAELRSRGSAGPEEKSAALAELQRRHPNNRYR